MSENNKITNFEKIAYGIGDAGCNIVWTTIGSFLMLYYTDFVGFNAAVVGTIMMIPRFLDGIADLGIGIAIDHTNTRWGKARPWILWSSILMALGMVMVFNVPLHLHSKGKFVYAIVTYTFVASFAYTACNLSYNTLLSLISSKQHERTVMTTIRFICTTCIVLAISYLTIKFVNNIGWQGMSFVYGGVALIFLLITFSGTNERYDFSSVNNEKKVSLFRSLKLIIKNKYFILVTLLFITLYAAAGLNMSVGIYYARDVLGHTSYYGTMILAMVVPMLFGYFLFPIFVSKFGKWKCMMGGLFIQIIGFMLILIYPTNFTLIIIGLAIKGLGSVPNTAGLFALVADVVDYGEWTTGERIDGLTYSATSFGMKMGTGFGAASVGWGLAIGNYNAVAVVQPDSVLFTIKVLYYVLPIIFTVIGAFLLIFINLDKIYPQISSELKLRHDPNINERDGLQN